MHEDNKFYIYRLTTSNVNMGTTYHLKLTMFQAFIFKAANFDVDTCGGVSILSRT